MNTENLNNKYEVNHLPEIYRLDSDGKVTEAEKLPENRLSCALGCFDGVHIGHRILLETAKSNSFGLTPAIWTFTKPISKAFIEAVPDRLSVCGQFGIEIAVCESFDDVKKMTPEQFVSHLHNDFGVRHFICGCDFRFGAERAGDAEALKRIAFNYGDCVTVVPSLTLELLEMQKLETEGKKDVVRAIEIDPCTYQHEDVGEKVSSSLVRERISSGDVKGAAELLGRRFGITAKVCDGKQLGRQIGMPTINQKFDNGRIVPRFGVYYSIAIIDEKEYPAVTNIGSRPTVNSDESDVTCETHILDYTQDIYGKTVRVELCDFAREERKFADIDELKSAITGDILAARAFFGLSQD